MTLKEALTLYREGKATLTAIQNSEKVTLYLIVPTGDKLPSETVVK
jgi:hypothetical protein